MGLTKRQRASRKYYLENRQKIIQAIRQYVKKNKEKVAIRRKAYCEKNKEKLAAYWRAYARKYRHKKKVYLRGYYLKNRKRLAQWQKEYELKNRVRIARTHRLYRLKHKKRLSKIRKKYEANRWKTDLIFRMRSILRARLNAAIKGECRKTSAVRHLGCSIKKLKQSIEKQFLPGMSWKNWSRSGWHIDHIRPLHSFNLKSVSQQRRAFHFSNLRPLWAYANWQKGKTWLKS